MFWPANIIFKGLPLQTLYILPFFISMYAQEAAAYLRQPPAISLFLDSLVKGAQ